MLPPESIPKLIVSQHGLTAEELVYIIILTFLFTSFHSCFSAVCSPCSNHKWLSSSLNQIISLSSKKLFSGFPVSKVLNSNPNSIPLTHLPNVISCHYYSPHSGLSPALRCLHFMFSLPGTLPCYHMPSFSLNVTISLLITLEALLPIFVIISNYITNLQVHCLFLPKRKNAERAHNSFYSIRRSWGSQKLYVLLIYLGRKSERKRNSPKTAIGENSSWCS